MPNQEKNADGLTELFSKSGDAPADFLLAEIDRINANSSETMGCAPMLCAAASLRADLIAPLAQRGYDINGRSLSGCNPLFYAIDAMDKESDASCVKELLRLGADWSAQDDYGQSALSIALHGRQSAIRALFEDPASFETISSTGDTPLTLALQTSYSSGEEQAEMIELLIELGASVEFKDGVDETPLVCACKLAHPLAARALINAGADVNARSDDGESPLMAALKIFDNRVYDSAPIVAALLSAGADPYLENKNGQSALSLANDLMGDYPSDPGLNALLAWDLAHQLRLSIKTPHADAKTRPGL